MTDVRQLKLPVATYSSEAYEKALMLLMSRGPKQALNILAQAKFADYYKPLKMVGISLDFCPTIADIQPYKILVYR